MSVAVLPKEHLRSKALPNSLALENHRRAEKSTAIFSPLPLFTKCLGVALILFVFELFCSHVSGGTDSNLQPVITGFAPTAALPGSLIILSGSNLLQVSEISFNGVDAPVYGSADDGSAVQTAVPTNAISGPVSVVTQHGSTTSANPFVVMASGTPVVSRFDPMAGPVGTAVTIFGSNLNDVTSIEFSGAPASFSTVQGLITYVPTNAATGPITLATRLGTFTSVDIFTVTALGPPRITSFAPTNGPVGTFVEFTGTNLTKVKSVAFNGTPGTFVDYGSATEPHPGAIVPTGASTGPITIVTESGSFVTSTPFIVATVAAPVITSFRPASARVGDSVTLMGSNFIGVRSVSFSGVKAAILPFLPTQMDVQVPYAPSGAITIITDWGAFTTLAKFTVVDGAPPLGVTSVSPSSAPPGAVVSILLTNLLGTVTAVSFNGTEGLFAVYGNEVVAQIPTLATSGPVAVKTSTSDAVTSSPIVVFRSDELATESTCSRDPVLIGTSAVFSISITNLGSAPIGQLVVTNTFASGEPTTDQFVTWTNGQPSFIGIAPADLTIISAKSTQGNSRITNGMVISDLGTLPSSETVTIEIEATPLAPAILYELASVTGSLDGLGQIYGSFLNQVTVSNAVALAVRQNSSTDIEITWPISASALILQKTDSAFPTATWSTVTEPVSVVAGHNSVLLSTSSQVQFFRLVPAPP